MRGWRVVALVVRRGLVVERVLGGELLMSGGERGMREWGMC